MMFIIIGVVLSAEEKKRQGRGLKVEKWRDVTCLVRHISGGTRHSCSGGELEPNMLPLLVHKARD